VLFAVVTLAPAVKFLTYPYWPCRPASWSDTR